MKFQDSQEQWSWSVLELVEAISQEFFPLLIIISPNPGLPYPFGWDCMEFNHTTQGPFRDHLLDSMLSSLHQARENLRSWRRVSPVNYFSSVYYQRRNSPALMKLCRKVRNVFAATTAITTIIMLREFIPFDAVSQQAKLFTVWKYFAMYQVSSSPNSWVKLAIVGLAGLQCAEIWCKNAS